MVLPLLGVGDIVRRGVSASGVAPVLGDVARPFSGVTGAGPDADAGGCGAGGEIEDLRSGC